MTEPDRDERPRVLSARFGANPNSSSLGVDVSFLLFGGAGALAASLLLSAWLRSRKGSRPEEVGQPPPPVSGAGSAA
jgi:hypothetical protein